MSGYIEGAEAQALAEWGYMYEDGSFRMEGTAELEEYGTVDFQFGRIVKGVFDGFLYRITKPEQLCEGRASHFLGRRADALNQLVYNRMLKFASLNASVFSADTGLTAEYESEVTLYNDKMVSVVF